MASNWPQVGDDAIELRHAHGSATHDRIGVPVTIKKITQTMVVTSNGERYNRDTLKPISEGRYSARTLVQPHDDRVLCVRGRESLEGLARLTSNLAKLEHTAPAEIFAALAQVVANASRDLNWFREQMRDASRAEQVSNR